MPAFSRELHVPAPDGGRDQDRREHVGRERGIAAKSRCSVQAAASSHSGRVILTDQLGLKIIDALDPRDNRVTGDPFGNVPPRYNGAPSQQLWVIRQNPQTGERSLDLLQWGLIP